jgi:Mysoin-binding motif of peroxisomes
MEEVYLEDSPLGAYFAEFGHDLTSEHLAETCTKEKDATSKNEKRVDNYATKILADEVKRQMNIRDGFYTDNYQSDSANRNRFREMTYFCGILFIHILGLLVALWFRSLVALVASFVVFALIIQFRMMYTLESACQIYVTNARKFDCRIFTVLRTIQETELVANGFKLTTPLAPITRIENFPRTCIFLRRFLLSSLGGASKSGSIKLGCLKEYLCVQATQRVDVMHTWLDRVCRESGLFKTRQLILEILSEADKIRAKADSLENAMQTHINMSHVEYFGHCVKSKSVVGNKSAVAIHMIIREMFAKTHIYETRSCLNAEHEGKHLLYLEGQLKLALTECARLQRLSRGNTVGEEAVQPLNEEVVMDVDRDMEIPEDVTLNGEEVPESTETTTEPLVFEGSSPPSVPIERSTLSREERIRIRKQKMEEPTVSHLNQQAQLMNELQSVLSEKTMINKL